MFKNIRLVSSLIGHAKKMLKNMTKNLCFLCFLNVIIICIHWFNLKELLLIKRLKMTKKLVYLK